MGKLRDLMVSVCLCMNTVRVARAQAACACGAKGTGVCLAMNLRMHTHKHRHIHTHTDKVSNWQKTAAANQKMHVNIPIMIWPTGNHGTLNNLAPS